LGAVLSKYLPKYLGEVITNMNRQSERKFSRKIAEQQKRELGIQLKDIESEIKRFVWYSVLLIFGFIAFYSLGYDIYSVFQIYDYSFTIWMFIQFFIIVLIFIIFVKTVLSPLTKLILQAIFGKTISKWTISKEHEKLEASINYLFIYIGVIFALNISFPFIYNLPFWIVIYYIIAILGIIIGVAFSARLILFIFRIYYTIPSHMDSHAANAMENIIVILSLLVVIGLILSFFQISATVILGSLAFIGFALAFGMQDSVANIMAGFMLAGDKPFAVGDRIRLGEVGRETWGDVVKIGLNTTRIRTEEGELVVVPNAYIAKNEIWNYTRESPTIVHKVDIGISYGSDWRLAKKIILEEARAHPRVITKPQPFVRMDKYDNFSINFKVWVWLKHALDRDQVRSDLLESIKDRFDAEGVEIPFPYRTTVYKRQLPLEKKLTDPSSFTNVRRYPSLGKNYFEHGDWHIPGKEVAGPVVDAGIRILVTSASAITGNKMADFSMDFAKKVNGKIIALYVMHEYSRQREEEGLKILNIFERKGKEKNILVGTVIEIGDVVEQIINYTKENKVDFIIIGKSPRGGAFSWAKENIEEEIKKLSDVPVITVQE
jgi:small-conductance mechanosensitive channel/nucleotide-binding universal stress UspA family protein